MASQFLEVTKVFGALPEEIDERIKYAKWKATDIVKAINEGRTPQPGPPGASSSPPQQQTAHAEKQDIVSICPKIDTDASLPSFSGQFPPDRRVSPPIKPPHPPQHLSGSSPPPSATSSTDPPQIILPPISMPRPAERFDLSSPPPASPVPSVSPVLDPALLSQAEKYARFAISAIQFEDITTATTNLELCLSILRGVHK